MTIKVSPDDLHTAAQWLEIYEGAGDAERCRRVSKWLVEQAEAMELRQACREAGVTVARARAALRKAKAGAR